MGEQGKISRKKAISRAVGAGLGASLLGAFALLTSTASAQEADRLERVKQGSLEQRGRFTPARGDARLAAALAKDTRSDRVISFTPAGTEPSDDKLRVAVRADSNQQGRAAAASPEVRRVAGTPAALRLTPNSYNLGVEVGWKRFSVSGGVSQQRSKLPAIEDRERAAVGVSYDRKSFGTTVAVSGERNASPIPTLGSRETYSLDVGGKINVSKHIAVTGGVRYRIDQERLGDPVVEDPRRESQAVYVGTKLRF